MSESYLVRTAERLRREDPVSSVAVRAHYGCLQEELSLLYRLVEPLTGRWSREDRALIEQALASSERWRATDLYVQRAIAGTVRERAKEAIGRLTLAGALDV